MNYVLNRKNVMKRMTILKNTISDPIVKIKKYTHVSLSMSNGT